MEQLKCDVCGGTLVMLQGGVAQCEYCGVKYSMESLREKVQEIRGTVSVQGIATAENVLQRAKSFHEEKDYERAKEYYNKYLDLNPQDEEVKTIVYELEHPPVRMFVCQVCGFVHEQPQPPVVCPICNAPGNKFKGRD